jgi:ABC-2 type transport system ATP-binding protein
MGHFTDCLGLTALISILAGVLIPKSGSATCSLKFAIVPQSIALYRTLTARENLNFFSGLLSIPHSSRRKKIAEIGARLGLAAVLDQPVATYSGGMMRRLNIGIALVGQPDVIALDEPTVGIDPQSREAIFELLKEISARGTTILYATHYMEEVERLCQSLTLIDGGHAVYTGTVDDFRGRGRQLVRLHFGSSPSAEVMRDIEMLAMPSSIRRDGERVTFRVDDWKRVKAAIFAHVSREDISEVEIRPESLHDRFIQLTGRDLRD